MRRLLPRLATATALVATSLCLAFRPEAAPLPLLMALAGAILPLTRAWRWARGTALRPAIAWAGLAIGLAAVAQGVALTESPGSGRPGSGGVVYLSTLAAMAATISVLNARNPGGGAWAILMALLVLVFLVPWLEGASLVREGGGWDRLRLAEPWTIFYGLIVLAGVTNYLPTRLGPAAFWLGLGFVAEYLGLTRVAWGRPTRGLIWTVVPLCWATAAWVGDLATLRPGRDRPGLDRLWSTFRDAWGVVWALRVQERFNRAAASAGWPIRLTWQGVAPEDAEVPPAAVATLSGLLRRFATAERWAEAEGVIPESPGR